MARRKRDFLDDGSDSSTGSQEDDLDEQGFEDDDPDARAERSLFEDPYQRKKRRRVGGKDDATYGVFGDEDEDGESGLSGSRKGKRLHFTQAPAFVTGEERKIYEDMPPDEANEDAEVEDYAETGENEQSNSEDGSPQAGTPHEVNEIPEENSQLMGIGGLSSAAHQFTTMGRSSRRRIGSGGVMDPGRSLGGIGSSKWKTTSAEQSLPEAFESTSRRPQRSFLRDGTGSATSSVPGTPKLSREEQLHFNKLQGSFGAKLMAKMGWKAGTGLGAAAEGIVTPVETKLRPKPSMGLAYHGFKEKTAQSKAEAKRRGEIVSDEDEPVPRRARTKEKGRPPLSDAWKKPKRSMLKIEHQTYEQIVQNAGVEPGAGIGKIYDATGGEMREVSSLADVALPSASWTPSTDTMRIAEVRHNLRLISDMAKGDLDGLAKEAKALEERKKWVGSEDNRLRHKVSEEADLIARLQSVHLIMDALKDQSRPSSSDYQCSLDVFSPHIERLVTEFAKEYDVYRLDECVIGAISPVIQDSLASWKPLQDPTFLANTFRRWRRALKFSSVEEHCEDSRIDIYGARNIMSKPLVQSSLMTPYESLMWNVWLPKIRSCINNEWSPRDAAPAIQLYETWSNLLPPFIRDNMLDQLVIPKVQKAIIEWQPHVDGPTLREIVFPWLPHVGLRMEDLLTEARRKVKGILRTWSSGDGVPEDLHAWKDVFGTSDWEAMVLKYILPKLGASLREDFNINPRKQDMTVFRNVLQWCSLLRTSMFSQLLETEFFPKWLDVLYVWLIQPKASFKEVADWYSFWKEDVFPQEVLELPDVVHGFTRGLQLMNKAMELGPNAMDKLPRPDHGPPVSPLVASGVQQGGQKLRSTPARTIEITFRSIVEEFAASHDLLFIPTGRAHEQSRMPLFKVSHSVDGKGGVLVFILDDAVWALEGEDYRAITLEEMVLRANKTR